MKMMSKNEQWFASEEGQASFAQSETLEQKISFLYSYLVTIREQKGYKNEDAILTKMAILLADGVLTSDLPYAAVPKFLDVKENPFLAYVKNADALQDTEQIYISLLSILHEIADPFVKSNWIYDPAVMNQDALKDHLGTLEHEFIASPSLLPDPECFKIEEPKAFIQLEIIWLFGQAVCVRGENDE